jgi:hypothetical protein
MGWKRRSPVFRDGQPRKRRLWPYFILLTVTLGLAWLAYSTDRVPGTQVSSPVIAPETNQPGRLIGVDQTRQYNGVEAAALIRQNYGATPIPAETAITKIIFHYQSQDLNGEYITVYGRAYIPASDKPLPLFAFAPGTTGIGDKCAPSLEDPTKANWANYDSHMAMYAEQGYVAVTTDYEGMRDDGRMHHYMVGELEGRVLLDAIRAVRQLPKLKDKLDSSVFVAGYSQGGHAAYWADKINTQYAPDITLAGVIGFGPVMSVRQTLTDVTKGANINWFGPYVLTSYTDYYKTDFHPELILLPTRLENLKRDVENHCIDTNLTFWGHTPAGVYTPEFIGAMSTNTLVGPYQAFGDAMDKNAVGEVATTTPKLINEGAFDNVVLPAQQRNILPGLCKSSKGPVQFKLYPKATHYDTMKYSLADTLGWMNTLRQTAAVPSTCS